MLLGEGLAILPPSSLVIEFKKKKKKRGGNVFLFILCLVSNALAVVEEAVPQTALVGKQVSYLFSLFCLDMTLVTELHL